MAEAREFFLWPGTGAIADLEDGESYPQALAFMRGYIGDCTLWERQRLPTGVWRTVLLAVKMGGQVIERQAG